MNVTQSVQYDTVWYSTKMCLLIVAALMLFPALSPYRWNYSASVPIGLYRVRKEQPTVGSLVAFCLPKGRALYAKERGYIHFGFSCSGWTQELLKPVVAVAGDTVEIAPEGVTVRGCPISNTKVFNTDSHGRSHYVWITDGEHIVPPDTVFVLSAFHENSWDSRYFGFVSSKKIITTMEPIWTW